MSLIPNKINVPNDIINHILSFGDPEITKKYNLCLIQLLYNKKEFDYLRQLRMNTYYNWKKHHFKYFILTRNLQKKNINSKTKYKPLIKKTNNFIHNNLNLFIII